MKIPYKKLLIASILVMLFIFWGEYFVWDKSPDGISIPTMLMELVTIGVIYAMLIWGFAIVLYFICAKIVQLIQKAF